MKLQLLDSFAQRHHGLVNSTAAARVGISRATWYRAIASGQLEQLYPNVVRTWGAAETFEQRALAAAWAAGPDALTSHRTSAALWTVQRPPDDPLDVLLPSRARHSLPGGVVIHRPKDRLDLRPIMRSRVPTTNPMRMLLDLGAVDPDGVSAALLTVLTQRVASPAAIRAALFRHARKGRAGITALRVALEQWLDEELPPDSVLEQAMYDLVREFDLPPVEFHPMVLGYEIDFRATGTPVLIECDGWGSHGLDRNQFEFDRIRNSELVGAGYILTHVTWSQLRSDRKATAGRIRNVINRWSGPGIGAASA